MHQKTNPHNHQDQPWLHRNFARVEWRCLVRDVLSRQKGQQALEDMLGTFALSHVRGDFVPTIADSYAELLAIANAHGTGDKTTPAPSIPFQSFLSPDGSFRVEVRFVPVREATTKQETP